MHTDLEFIHPATDEIVTIETPLPMKRSFDYRGFVVTSIKNNHMFLIFAKHLLDYLLRSIDISLAFKILERIFGRHTRTTNLLYGIYVSTDGTNIIEHWFRKLIQIIREHLYFHPLVIHRP